MLSMIWKKDDYLINTDINVLDIEVIHTYLSQESYWAKGVPRNVVEKSIKNSLCFGLFYQEHQIGFARVISDYATFAYLGDVFVLEVYREQSLGKWLVACIKAHPKLQNLRRWMLATADAHGLYAKYGFTPLAKPDRFMELHDPGVYH